MPYTYNQSPQCKAPAVKACQGLCGEQGGWDHKNYTTHILDHMATVKETICKTTRHQASFDSVVLFLSTGNISLSDILSTSCISLVAVYHRIKHGICRSNQTLKRIHESTCKLLKPFSQWIKHGLIQTSVLMMQVTQTAVLPMDKTRPAQLETSVTLCHIKTAVLPMDKTRLVALTLQYYSSVPATSKCPTFFQYIASV